MCVLIDITEIWANGDQGWDVNLEGYLTYQNGRKRGKGDEIAPVNERRRKFSTERSPWPERSGCGISLGRDKK